MNDEAAASVAEGGIGVDPGMNEEGAIATAGASGDGVVGIIEADDGEELIPGGGAYLVFLPGPIEKLDVIVGA